MATRKPKATVVFEWTKEEMSPDTMTFKIVVTLSGDHPYSITEVADIMGEALVEEFTYDDSINGVEISDIG